MDLRRVRYFIALCETLSFSETARQLGLTQPTLTKAIRKLEAEIGGPLIRREGRLTHLTHLGRLMQEQLTQMDEVVRAVERRAQRFVEGDMPQVRLAVMCTIGPARFTAFVNAWRAANPHTELVLLDAGRERLAELLLSGNVDCALIGAPVIDATPMKVTELYDEPLVVAFPDGHPFDRDETIAFERIVLEPYLDRLDCEFRDTLVQQSALLGHPVTFAARGEREDWIQSLVRAGAGVTILPASAVVIDGLLTRPVEVPTLRRTVSLAIPYGREDSMAVASFLSAARGFDWQAV